MFNWISRGTRPPNKPRNNKTSSKGFFQNPFAAYPQAVVQQPSIAAYPQALVQQPSIAAYPQPVNTTRNNKKKGFFQNPFAAYTQPLVQQPVSIPIPVPVPVAVPAAQELNDNNNTNLTKYIKLLEQYRDLERKRYLLDTKWRSHFNTGVKADNMTENEEKLKKATHNIEEFLKNIPPDSINYKAGKENNNAAPSISKGDSFLSIAAHYSSAIGVRILCKMGANPNNLGEYGESLLEIAMQRRDALLRLFNYDPIEFITAVKECTGSKGGRRRISTTKKARRKRQYSSRRR